MQAPRGSNWDPGERVTLLGNVRGTLGMTNYVLDCFYPLQLRLMRCIVSYLCAAHCYRVASVERHGRRMHVAMVAQDLVVSKQPEAFHTHTIYHLCMVAERLA